MLLRKFHLVAFCCAGIELDSDTEDEDSEMSVKDRLLSLVARISGLKKTLIEVEESKPQSASKCIYVVKALSLSHLVRFGYCALQNAFYHFYMPY